MIYVFDTGPLVWMFRYYYEGRFPTLWGHFDELVREGRAVSVREVKREIDGQNDRLEQWASDNSDFFHKPAISELQFISQIFAVRHFQDMVRMQEQLQGKPVADPFVIAKANETTDGCVVTTETLRPNAPKIPNVCQHFGVPWLNVESFMETEGWTF